MQVLQDRVTKHTKIKRKKKKVEQRRGQKRAAVLDELNDSKEQKKRMKSNIGLAGKVTFISKSNAVRRSPKEKQGILKSIEEEINRKLEALKNQFCMPWNVIERLGAGVDTPVILCFLRRPNRQKICCLP